MPDIHVPAQAAIILVQCKPMPGREDSARRFIRENFNTRRMPSLVRMSLMEVDRTMDEQAGSAPDSAPGARWVLSLESDDIARTALAVHECLLGCESSKTGLLVGSWTRYQLISAHESAAPPWLAIPGSIREPSRRAQVDPGSSPG